MRRVLTLGLVVGTVLAASGGATSAAAETVTVGPGLSIADSVLLTTAFQLDAAADAIPVPMTVSGTITLSEAGLEPKLYDAFYCYSGCDGIQQSSGLAFGHDAGTGGDIAYQDITVFVKGNTSGNFVATPAYSETHTYTFPFVCDENSRIVCGQLRAIGVPFADPPADVIASGSLTVALDTGAPPSDRCAAVEGRVSDQEAKPVPGAHVRLESAGTILDEAGTGTDGRYRLAVPPEAGADLRVVLLAEEWAHSPSRFRVMVGTDVIGVASPPIDPTADTCTQDFAMAGLAAGMTPIPPNANVPAAFGAYQAVDAAWTLAVRLGSEPAVGLPLPVFLSCERAQPPGGVVCPVDPGVHFFFTETRQPYIAVSSTPSASGPADMANMLGHEFGHFFMWSAFGEIPRAAGNTNHGGYYVNPSSSDAWTEGFASFYSLMVRREVSGVPEATVVGSRGDMEPDAPAWQAAGRFEEFAVVGILLDLVDGPGASAGGPDHPVTGEVLINDGNDLFVAEVPPGTAVGTPWRMDLVDSAGRRLRTIRGAVVEWRGVRLAIGSLPAIPYQRLSLALRPAGRPLDDDPITGDLFALWPAILNYRSPNPASAAYGNHVFDVQDLYHVSQLLYGSDRDRDGNGVVDVDEIFARHGFFADTDGGASDRIWDLGERAGFSSHTESTVGPDRYPPMIPRSSPPVLPELQARIDTGGVDATALVQVEFPEDDASFATLVTPDAQGMVPLPVPPEASGGRVSVIVLAEGYGPALALEVEAGTFWPQAERNAGHSFLSATVVMEPGVVVPGELGAAGDGGSVGWLLWAFLVVALIVVAVVAVVALVRRRGSGPPSLAGLPPAPPMPPPADPT